MKYILIIAIVVIGIVAYVVFQPKLQECPDAIAGNLMPGAGGKAYYLKNGEARKISDYDAKWVNANCRGKIEDKTVN
jgi:hypothetical protein